ncbi:MAG: ATP-dependent zinc protease [Magnetococcales bacterium]|nr:ATP-dependent zinc protease [Magnetococcales bacterium]
MKGKLSLWLLAFFTSLSTCSYAYSHESDLPVVGYVEKVKIFLSSENIVIKAKIDTGAKTSSLDVDSLSFFTRSDEDWVRFTVTDDDGESIKLSLPVERSTRIRRAGARKDERPVVKLGLCLGKYYKEGEVNLSEREGMNYPMLIGRRFLSKSYIVDSSRKFMQKKPKCKKRE